MGQQQTSRGEGGHRMTKKETSASPPSLPPEFNTNKCNYFRLNSL